MRARKFPVVGNGAGVWSHIHLDDAAAATVLALGQTARRVQLVDYEPAPCRVWLPSWPRSRCQAAEALSQAVARLFAGEAPVVMSTGSRGAANAKAKNELGWAPRYPSWRQGFAAAYGNPGPSGATA